MIVITRQMQYAKQSELGFNKDAIVMIPLEADSMNIQVTTLKNKLSNIPGVEKVSLCYAAPAAQENWFNSIRFDNRPEFESFRVNIKAADDQYLPTFDLKLVAGRNMFPSDSVREFLVNESMISKLGLPSPQEAIGKKIYFDGGTMSATIVGVLKDFHDQSFHEDISALCITTHTELYNNYAIKVNTAKIINVLPALESAWSSMHPDKIYGHQFLDERIAVFL